MAGLLAGGAGLGAGELLAALIGPIRSPLLAVADRVVDLSPTGVREWAITTLGTQDKPVTILGTILILAAASAGMGVLAARSRRAALGASAGALAVGTIGAAAAWTGRNGGFAAGLGALVGGAVAAGAMWVLFGATRAAAADGVGAAATSGGGSDPTGDAPAESPAGSAASPGVEGPLLSPVRRRTVLTGLGAGAVAQLALAGAIRFVGGRGRAQEARQAVALPEVPEPLDALPADPAADGTVSGLSSLITPNDRFYRIDTAFTVPNIDLADWTLTIAGGTDGPVELTYDDLLARDQIEMDCTLSCVSNEVGGDLVGNARWQGVELAPILAEAGIAERITQVGATSTDGWTCGFPLTNLDRPDGDPTPPAIIALGMNGEPLPLDHGFPARLVIPGLYGYVSACKWLETIELTTWEDFTGYWIPRGWSEEAPIKTQSRIDVPTAGATLNAGAQTIAGVAWAGTRGLSKVEVRLDGEAWLPATLGPELSEATWRQWWLDWDVPSGSHTMSVRATDGDGTTQTAQPARPDPDGATGWHSVTVTVR
ncbi:MAG: molybdopterin-dependent oxidoreductase [Microthrixaceae bacterium]